MRSRQEKQFAALTGKLADGRDGISYLKAAMDNGIKTPLSDAYAREVLRKIGARNLGEAIAKARAT